MFFKDRTKSIKVKCKESTQIEFCINNKGEEIAENMILLTRFEVLETEAGGKSAKLKALSRKSNGDVFFDGVVRLIF